MLKSSTSPATSGIISRLIDAIDGLIKERYRFQVRESVKTAQLRVKTKQENVSGVQLPTFEMTVDGQNGKQLSLTFEI
jgi:vacuolar-type H+-ATPase subunit D/Vma8